MFSWLSLPRPHTDRPISAPVRGCGLLRAWPVAAAENRLRGNAKRWEWLNIEGTPQTAGKKLHKVRGHLAKVNETAQSKAPTFRRKLPQKHAPSPEQHAHLRMPSLDLFIRDIAKEVSSC